MKKYLIFVYTLLIPMLSFGQGALDALRFSQYRYEGSARSMAMGNAFTSLGGDSYALSINPASSAIYKYSEFTFTPSLYGTTSKSLYLDNPEKESWTRVAISNFGYISPIKLAGSNSIRSISFGVAINKLNNFTSREYLQGVNNSTSWLASLAQGLDGINNSNLNINDKWNPFYDYPEATWREILAWNSNLLDPLSSNEYIAATENISPDNTIVLAGPIKQDFFREQKGGISEMIFNMGANVEDILHFGLNLTIQTLDYSSIEKYRESAQNPSQFSSRFSDFTHSYRVNSTGVGFNMKAGVIVTPIEGLRLGASVATPTWFTLKDSWEESINARYSDGYRSSITSPLGEYDYRVNTPFRWNFGASYVFGKFAIASIDYEVVDYSTIKMLSQNYIKNEFADANKDIRDGFTQANSIRAGFEIRPTSHFSLRGGYTMYENPEKSFGHEMQFVSGGVGISGKSGMFIDFALQKSLKSSELFSLYNDYASYSAPIGKNEYSGWKFLFTWGVRF